MYGERGCVYAQKGVALAQACSREAFGFYAVRGLRKLFGAFRFCVLESALFGAWLESLRLDSVML